MTRTEIGPGVRRFREARERGEEPDAAALGREYPDEMLAIADEVRRAATRDDSDARQQMWLARAAVLQDAGEDVTLGAMLRRARSRRGLTIDSLVEALRHRGKNVLAMAFERLESNRATVRNVDPAVWAAIVEELEVDHHRALAGITMAVSAPHSNRTFTRMERGATGSEREKFVDQAASPESDDVVAGEYLERVREAFGLPSALSDTSQ